MQPARLYIRTERLLVRLAQGWTLEAFDPRYHNFTLSQEVTKMGFDYMEPGPETKETVVFQRPNGSRTNLHYRFRPAIAQPAQHLRIGPTQYESGLRIMMQSLRLGADPDPDDLPPGTLVQLACTLANVPTAVLPDGTPYPMPFAWPAHFFPWRPAKRRENLLAAILYLMAEIDRLDRAAL